MKISRLMWVILGALLLGGCSKPISTDSIMCFEADEVMNVEVQVFTEEESEVLVVSDAEGISEFMKLLQKVEIEEEAEIEASEVAPYYDYTFRLVNGDTIRFTDYQDLLKVINEEGEIFWYDIKTNTWDGLTYLWLEYADIEEDADALKEIDENGVIPMSPVNELIEMKEYPILPLI